MQHRSKPVGSDLTALSAAEAAAGILTRDLSSEELVRACLDRALSRDDAVQAWVHLDPETALNEARLRDRSARIGVLHGVPVAVKDVFDVAGMPARYGSPIYQDHYPDADAASVALLRAAGAVILGKTAAVEFSASEPTKTRNPCNLEHTPGGSSSGSAAAVADRHVPIATGTQTGGSTVRPAAYCGIVGFKPSFGSLCLAGVKMCAWSLDTLGLFARNVTDVSLMHAALTGMPSIVATVSNDRPRISVFFGPFVDQAEDSARLAVVHAADQLAVNGFAVTTVQAPIEFKRTLAAQRIIARYEMARSLAYEWECKRDLLSARIQEELDEGWSISFERYGQAKICAAAARQEIDRIFDDTDILLTLATTSEAPEGLGSTGKTTFNSSWSLLGNPCLCLPAGVGIRGLPLSVQLVGRFGADHRFLHHASAIERALVVSSHRV